MAVLNDTYETLEDLFFAQIEDLYDAEQRLTKAIPKLVEAASDPELADAFKEHLGQTENHVRRLERIFQMSDREPSRRTCDAMKGLVKEGEDAIKAKGDDHVRDAALIAAAQRVEHYEMAGYGTVRNFARKLKMGEAAELLQETLDEEGETDKILTQLAETSINPSAAHGA